jgi:hypothetical protein
MPDIFDESLTRWQAFLAAHPSAVPATLTYAAYQAQVPFLGTWLDTRYHLGASRTLLCIEAIWCVLRGTARHRVAIAAARRGIHVHVYGNRFDDLYRMMARDLSLAGATREVALLRRFLHIHPSLLRIPVIPATQSGAKLPPNPKEACHPIRTKAAPHRSPIGAQRRLG